MLASFPKSGNTWTRLFFYALQSKAREIDLDHFANNASKMDAQKDHYARIYGKDANDLTQDEIGAATPLVQRMIAESNQGRQLVKTHMANGEWHGTRTMNFDVIRSAIYILRNPLDVTASFAAHMNLPIDQAILNMGKHMNWLAAATPEKQKEAKQVPQLLGSWSQHVSSWSSVPDPRVTVVRYEDLKKDAVTNFKRMVDAIGMRATREEVANAVEKTDFAQIQKREKKQGFKEVIHDNQTFFRSGKSGGWREELTDEQVKLVIRFHAFQMARFDYIPEDYKEYAQSVMADSQTAKYFISKAKRERASAKKNNLVRRKKAGAATARPAVSLPKVGVAFPSMIKTQFRSGN